MKNITITLCIGLFLFFNSLFAQDSCGTQIVSNGNFETPTDVCTSNQGGPYGTAIQLNQIWFDQTPVTDWYGTTKRIDDFISFPTSDYFNAICTTPGSVQPCFAEDGASCVGYWIQLGDPTQKEYLQTKLLMPLEAGEEYCISVRAKAGRPTENPPTAASDRIAFWFHDRTFANGDGFFEVNDDNDGLDFIGEGSRINANPQLMNPRGNLIGGNCQDITFTYCPENSGDQYLVIGNFIPGRSDSGRSEYMSIDDVNILKSCPVDFDLEVKVNGTLNCSGGGCVDLIAEVDNQRGGCEITNDFTFQWLLNGNPIPGATGASINVCPDPITDVYSIRVTYTAKCKSATKAIPAVIDIGNGVNAGEDGIINLCQDDTNIIDLFTLLGGNPDMGGTWTPALASGTGVYNPMIDPAGIYTYTINAPDPCPSDSAEVLVALIKEANAGNDGASSFCPTSTETIDLFLLLGGNPDAGGQWTPPLASGTSIFNPTIDPAGTYTYTVNATAPCDNDEALVILTPDTEINAGTDGATTLCNNSDAETIDLFDILGGNPDLGGTWTPPLESGTSIYDPTIDPPGTYTYTIEGNTFCPGDSAEVLVTLIKEANAGNDGASSFCPTSTETIDLFLLLGGNPDADGQWTPPLASGTSIFNPTIDPAGTYTYTVNATAPCDNDEALVILTPDTEINAGTDGATTLCNNSDAETIDLFDILGGNPDLGGTWTPPLESGTSIYDPTIDPPGTYTYTIEGNTFCPGDSAEVLVTLIKEANAGNDGASSFCPTSTETIDLFLLLGGNPDADGQWAPPLASGTSIFNPTIDPAGTYIYTVQGLMPCLDDTSSVILTISNSIQVFSPSDLVSCDNDNDNIEPFDLNSQSPVIVNNNPNYLVTYHSTYNDALLGANQLISPYTNIVNPQIIYVRVEDVLTGCYDVSIDFELIVDEQVIANPDTIIMCDDEPNLDNNPTNDNRVFNINASINTILGNQNPADHTVLFYLNKMDADNGVNPVNSPYENITNPQTLIAKVINNQTACEATAPLMLIVNPLPHISLDDYTICLDENGTVVSPVTINTELDSTLYSFQWYLNGIILTEETGSTITPNTPGIYNVVVTDNATGCSTIIDDPNTFTTVSESALPTITATQTSISFIENNVILVTVNNANNDRVYEFSLDNGPWVSNASNPSSYKFEDVSAGVHNIRVNDINGCGIISVSIIVLDYIPYFTPNGDGYHDTWNILGIENQPDATLYIFNRYGKLLKQLAPTGKGWDGTLNGFNLPSTDYWFVLDYRDPNDNSKKTFKAHFALKR